MKKKVLSALLFTFIFTLMFSCTIFASSYTTSVSFKVSCTGETRKFDGNNIYYGATTDVSFTHATNDEYTVALYRKKLIGSDLVGSAKLKREGYDSCEWTNVGSGKYYLYFSKANDNVLITSDDVCISN